MLSVTDLKKGMRKKVLQCLSIVPFSNTQVKSGAPASSVKIEMGYQAGMGFSGYN